MSQRWSFNKVGAAIHFRTRVEGPGGIVGDASDVIQKGGKVLNLTYDELAKAGAGVVVIERGVARIEDA